jgi:hypothetical protein
VITHEIGHHVQNLLGILPQVQAAQRGISMNRVIAAFTWPAGPGRQWLGPFSYGGFCELLHTWLGASWAKRSTANTFVGNSNESS